MAVEAEASAQIDPKMVGHSFVEQYYKILHQIPDQVHRFYQESSFLSRPRGTDGVMVSTTTLKGISEQIDVLDYQNCLTEIVTVDAQGSYGGGVTVLVTGYLIGKDSDKRKFAQSFFLAPQENGFFVLNDVFRYVDDKQPLGIPISITINDVETAAFHPEPTEVPNHSSVSEDTQEELVTDTVQNGKASAPEQQKADNNVVNHTVQTVSIGNDLPVSPKTLPSNAQTVTGNDYPKKLQKNAQNGPGTSSPIAIKNSTIQSAPKADSTKTQSKTHSPRTLQNNVEAVIGNVSPRGTVQNGIQIVTKTDSPRTIVQDDGSKKSFASIVNKLKDNSAPFQVRVPPPTSKLSQGAATSKTSPRISSIIQPSAKSASIFVANLPLDVTIDQVRQVFAKFGPIKANGVRVRTNQLRPNCFSFVEFESANSVQNALKVIVNSNNGRKPQEIGTVGCVGVNSPRAQLNNEVGRVQSKANQKQAGKTTNSAQQNKVTRKPKQ
ncbi:hypothetical protein Pint_21198 [Pistacia integerrima]|uniref:Uncharacterized protein n=1 Tax=Pistacia integerrima TaxID=434235 RepID=A0ACC0X9F0_9ROSI|nr:hypothetical protein Pint_21198 [Pistacia integerrima]